MQGYYGPGGEAMRDIFLGYSHLLHPEYELTKPLKVKRTLRKEEPTKVEDLETQLDDAPAVEAPHPLYGARIITPEPSEKKNCLFARRREPDAGNVQNSSGFKNHVKIKSCGAEHRIIEHAGLKTFISECSFRGL